MTNLRLITLLAMASSIAVAQSYDAKLFADMRWREIGPYRGGRTRALAGVPSQPNVFYIAAVNGGVWKTNDYGRTWNPIFDHEPTGSIGALAVAPSDPNIIFAGSGEGLQRPDLSTGDGIYKSTDAGKTWTHLGLRDGQQIPKIAIDPRDPNHLYVAVLGHPYGPNEERGLYGSTDGGQTFQKLLYKDENTGAKRCRDRSLESGCGLRGILGSAARALGKLGVGRHGRRNFQIDGWRQDVEAAEGRAAAGGRCPSQFSDCA